MGKRGNGREITHTHRLPPGDDDSRISKCQGEAAPPPSNILPPYANFNPSEDEESKEEEEGEDGRREKNVHNHGNTRFPTCGWLAGLGINVSSRDSKGEKRIRRSLTRLEAFIKYFSCTLNMICTSPYQ